jgi:hypothetical protein
LAALAALAVVLTPTGSAKPPPPPSGTYQACLIAGDGTGACTPTASGGDYSVLVGASVQLQVTIKNDSASNQTLDYANVNVPASIIGLSIDTAHIPQPATYKTYASTSTASTLQLRGLGLAPGASRTVAFFVNSPTSSCTDGNWTTRAQSSSTGSAFVFTNPPSQSGGLTSLVAVSCQLAFQNQPTAAIQTKTITSAPYNPLGPNVSVGPTPALPVALNGGSVTLGYDPGAFDPAGSSFTGTGTSFSGGVATFSSLKATGTGGPFTLNAHAAGFDTDALSSPPFAITQEGNACNPGTACNITGHDASGKALVQILTSTGFGFVGTSPSAVPQDANGDYPAGCQSWTPTNGVTGFVEFDGRTDGPSTSMTVTYDMPMNALKARYGKNVGQQFIPVCIGAKLVDSSGQAQDCVPETRGWLGDELANGAFTGGTFQSVCGPEGYYWGIISSFQDKLDQTANPVVTSWGSGQIGGTNYRSFTMSIPAGWDLHGSG